MSPFRRFLSGLLPPPAPSNTAQAALTPHLKTSRCGHSAGLIAGVDALKCGAGLVENAPDHGRGGRGVAVPGEEFSEGGAGAG
jgi:hypothetical protein